MEVVQYYPLKAALLGVKGSVTLQCAVTISGLLEACSVVSETPTGEGFGQAALRLSTLMRMRPALVDGQPVGGAIIRVPVAFETRGAEASLPGLTESLACLGRFTARQGADPTDAAAAEGAGWSRYWANKLMKLQRIPKETRQKRLDAAAAAFSAPPPRNDHDARCEKAFLPDPQP